MYAACFILTMLPPILILCVGIIWKVSPPKMDSKGLAYRTALSTRSEETWSFAHRHCSKLWIRPWHRTWVGDRSADVVFSGTSISILFCGFLAGQMVFFVCPPSSRSAVKKWI